MEKESLDNVCISINNVNISNSFYININITANINLNINILNSINNH